MNHHQASEADDAKDADRQPEAKPSGQAAAEAKSPASPDEEGRLRKAYGDVKDALKNSRHT